MQFKKPVVDFLLHDLVYHTVTEICYDREYIYLAFLRNFKALMELILEEGKSQSSGEYIIPGIKSDLEAVFEWNLVHRINYQKLNIVTLHCTVKAKNSAEIIRKTTGRYDLSTGKKINT